MQQLEIQYFFPLTEQIGLDLDFTPCKNYEEEKRKKHSVNSITLGDGIAYTTALNTMSLSNMVEFRPSPDSAGYWEVNKQLRYYVPTEPNWFVKKMSKLLLGWKWGEKN